MQPESHAIRDSPTIDETPLQLKAQADPANTLQRRIRRASAGDDGIRDPSP
jgi:hypothetical protein